jgi:hypothetical protein
VTRSELRSLGAARDLLLEDAEAVHSCHTTAEGDWGDEVGAKRLYDRAMRAAEDLRLIIVKYQPSRVARSKGSSAAVTTLPKARARQKVLP